MLRTKSRSRRGRASESSGCFREKRFGQGRQTRIETAAGVRSEFARVLKSRSRRASPEASPLTPELKDFIDRAIVPVLVKQFLAENKFAELESDAPHSDSSAAKSILWKVKP